MCVVAMAMSMVIHTMYYICARVSISNLWDKNLSFKLSCNFSTPMLFLRHGYFLMKRMSWAKYEKNCKKV